MPTSQHSCQFLLERDQGQHDVSTAALVVILLDELFAFDPKTHSTYADISGSEIAEGLGYLQKSKTLTNVTLSINASNPWIDVACSSPSWEAAGGDWPAIGSAAIINDTHASDTVVLCLDFETTYQIVDGQPFQIDFSSGLYTAKAIIGSTV